MSLSCLSQTLTRRQIQHKEKLPTVSAIKEDHRVAKGGQRVRWSSPCRECIFAKLLREELCSQKVEQKARRDLLEIGGDGRTDGDGRGPSHVGTGTQWGAWALTHNAQNHLEALFSIGLNCRGASKEIIKGTIKYEQASVENQSRVNYQNL